MSITSALYTGLSGLFAQGDSMGVTGDNIANVNTVGFRGSQARFESVLGRSIIGVGDIGSGVRLSQISKNFTQGSIVNTQSTTDMAISGRGFFVVRGAHDGISANFFTRAGQFTVDRDGLLVNPEGLAVQGYRADINGVIGSGLTDLHIGPNAIPPAPTTIINAAGNLDQRTSPPPEASPGVPVAFNPDDPSTYSNTTSINVYDSLGGAHQVTIYFIQGGSGTWTWHAVAPPEEQFQLPPGSTGEFASGTLTFSPEGLLRDYDGSPANISFANAAPNQEITFNFGSAIDDGGSGLDGLTQTSSLYSAAATADGYAAGDLVSIESDANGIIIGHYTNGRDFTMGRLALADFQDQQGLHHVGASLFTATAESGDPLIGFAGAGGRGSIRGSALEQSNVDLSQEFVRMITDQRAYQAASRTITTADEMLQETLNIKR